MTTAAQHPYTVRKMVGRGGVKFIVVKNAQRVSVHAHLSERSAWLAANELNISAMVADADQDSRPYAVRLAEAREAFVSVNDEGKRPTTTCSGTSSAGEVTHYNAKGRPMWLVTCSDCGREFRHSGRNAFSSVPTHTV